MAKLIYDMTGEEIVEYVNREARFYDETVNKDQQVSVDRYFNVARFSDEALYNLYFACDVMYKTVVGQKYADSLIPLALEMFEPLQLEFFKRIGHPDPYSALTVMKL
jgi:hypothetical protein